MRRFKLLKDFPDCNAGAISRVYGANSDWICFGESHYQVDFIEKYPDWFKEIKEEPVVFNPVLGTSDTCIACGAHGPHYCVGYSKILNENYEGCYDSGITTMEKYHAIRWTPEVAQEILSALKQFEPEPIDVSLVRGFWDPKINNWDWRLHINKAFNHEDQALEWCEKKGLRVRG